MNLKYLNISNERKRVFNSFGANDKSVSKDSNKVKNSSVHVVLDDEYRELNINSFKHSFYKLQRNYLPTSK